MKVVANRGVLVDALNQAGNVVAGRTPKPVLQCVLLVAEGGVLTVRTTDLEVDLRETIAQVKVEREGRVAVAADKLRDIVREMPGETVTLECGPEAGTYLHVRGNDDRFKLFTQKASEFPPEPSLAEGKAVKFTGKTFKRLIKQVAFAAAKETQRYAINGVLLIADKAGLTLVTTDGRRLAKSVGELSEKAAAARAILPLKLVALLAKFAPADDAVVTGQIVDDRRAVFEFDSTRLGGALIEGQFPPHEDVIPKDCDKRATAEVGGLISAIKRAALLTTEESKGVRMAFSRKGLVISSRSAESGEATVNLPLKYEGADLEIGFNPQFMMESLRVVDAETVDIEFTLPNRPGKITAGGFTSVVMPVNLQ